MGKQPPNLKLVSSTSGNIAGSSTSVQGANGFDLITQDELSSSEQQFVDRLLAEICPGAGVIAVARSSRIWDLRPVVARSGEEGPSIIRLSGPQISFSQPLHRRVRESLERLNRFTTLRTELRDWGEFEDQIWFRRTLVPTTLAHEIAGGFRWTPEEVYELIRGLFEIVASFHSHGLVHGHIATTNIIFSDSTGLALLDPAIGAALVQSEQDMDSAQAQSVAPEIRGRLQLQASADCFGLGQVSKRLLLKLRRKSQFLPDHEEVDQMVEELLKIVSPMVNADPGARPSLPELLVAVEDVIAGRGKGAIAISVEGQTTVGAGRIVRAGQVAVDERVPEQTEAIQDAVEQTTLDRNNELESDAAAGEAAVAEDQGLARKGSNWWLYLLGFACVAFCVWTIQRSAFLSESPQYTTEELRLAWESSIPSRMAPVAELALEEDGQLAEDIIIRSIYNGARLPQGVNAGLIKIAFDARWERRLTDEDRRMALALGVAALLGSNYPKDLGPLDERHPGLIFAVVATAGKNANPFLERIPAVVLEKLPGSLGQAFAVLAENHKEYTCASDAIRRLAQFSTHGVGRATDLADFLSVDTDLRLQALAKLYEKDGAGARAVLEATLSHPNIILEHPLIAWGREWELVTWPDLEATDRLAVLAGYAPQGRVMVENVGKMFSHPSAAVRGYAIERAIDRIRFAHPGSFAVLRQLVKNPELLDGRQLFHFAKLLENPTTATEQQLKDWFAKKPPTQLVSQLLLAGHDQKSATKFDTFTAMYLKLEKWEASMAQLRLLVSHPDDYTRLYAYQQVFEREGPEVAAILKAAREVESNGRFKRQLDQMLEQLEAR